MNRHIPVGPVDVLAFTGPDAESFLNGQITQDAGMVRDDARAAFSCVTDAKGRLQFRITITTDAGGAILAAVPSGMGSDLEARLTRYLIADDAEATLVEAAWEIHHFTGNPPAPPDGVLARQIDRFGEPGCDWWVPVGSEIQLPAGFTTCEGDALESLRVARAIPAWGRELTENMLPPEARLETTDISYQKGCYIGQEVISRIKSAGKVNRLLTRFEIHAADAAPGPLTDARGREAGHITTVAPATNDAEADTRHALGFLKRTADADTLRLAAATVRVVP